MQVGPVSNGIQQSNSSEAGHQIMASIPEEIVSSSHSGRNADLSVQIPPKPVVFGSSRSGKGLLQSPSSSKGGSTAKSLLQSLSFKNKAAVHDGEGSSLLTPDSEAVPESPVLSSFISALSWKRGTSLPVTPASILSPSISIPSERNSTDLRISHSSKAPPAVTRSLSVPMRNVVIVRSLSFATRTEPIQAEPSNDQICPIQMEDGDQEIPEEEAICRICYESLCEGEGEKNTFKLECSCKGALKLTHEECAVKWFTIKGNKNCDVCCQEVSNLPVTVLRVHSAAQRDLRHDRSRQNSRQQSISAWHDFVVLILISSISYFFILEQLLVRDMQYQAIILAAPFALGLGLLGSTFAIYLAIREYIWTYAAFEFAVVALILHVFYMGLHLSAVYSIVLAAVLGFGIVMGINAIYVYIFVYRDRFAQAQIIPDTV